MTDDYPPVLRCYERIYDIVREIPRGKVMTYGQIGALAREICPSPVPALTVGRAMAASGRYAPELPWWRVIGSTTGKGQLRSLRLTAEQAALLAREGVVPEEDGRYDLGKYLYEP